MAAEPDIRIVDQRTTKDHDRPFLPGMGKTWLMPMYDVFTRLIGVGALHRRVRELAGVAPGEAVVDVGCGTGNLSFAVLAAQPAARVTGLDPDGAALRRAARKARRRKVPLTLVQGYADRLPAEDGALDHVVSALAVHHLDDSSRAAFARDAFRALRPGSRITIADFGGQTQAAGDAGEAGHSGAAGRQQHHQHGPGHALRHLPRLLRSRARQNPAVQRDLGDGILTLLTGAGFSEVREVEHVEHRLGRVSFVQATRP